MRSETPGIWWLHPGWIVLAMGVVVITAAYLIPDSAFRLDWRTPKHFNAAALVVCCAAVAAFATGAFSGALEPRGSATREPMQDLPWESIRKAFSFCFWSTVAGYVAWAGAAAARGASLSLVLGVLRGEKGASYVMKETYLGTISGVTTLTQFGIAAVVLGAMIAGEHGWKSVRLRFAALFLMAIARALFNSERLAIIELAIPAALVLIRLKVLGSETLSRRMRAFLPFAPVVGGVALLLLFAASEYFRSWSTFYAGSGLGFWEFASLRLVGYYVTALNNGAVLLRYVGTTGSPFFMLHFLWRFPLVSSVMDNLYPNLPWARGDDPYLTVLDVNANPEFNNGSGYFMPALDVGLIGSLIFWLIAGLVCGLCYRLYTHGHVGGLLFYPVLFTGVVEMPRILYWGEGRIVPVYIVLAVIACRCLAMVRRRIMLADRVMGALETAS